MAAKRRARLNSVEDGTFISQAAGWLYHFATRVETSSEEDFVHDSLLKWLDFKAAENSVCPKVIADTREFFLARFVPLRQKICFRHYMDRPGGWNHTTSMSESENRRLKYSELGPRP